MSMQESIQGNEEYALVICTPWQQYVMREFVLSDFAIDTTFNIITASNLHVPALRNNSYFLLSGICARVHAIDRHIPILFMVHCQKTKKEYERLIGAFVRLYGAPSKIAQNYNCVGVYAGFTSDIDAAIYNAIIESFEKVGAAPGRDHIRLCWVHFLRALAKLIHVNVVGSKETKLMTLREVLNAAYKLRYYGRKLPWRHFIGNDESMTMDVGAESFGAEEENDAEEKAVIEEIIDNVEGDNAGDMDAPNGEAVDNEQRYARNVYVLLLLYSCKSNCLKIYRINDVNPAMQVHIDDFRAVLDRCNWGDQRALHAFWSRHFENTQGLTAECVFGCHASVARSFCRSDTNNIESLWRQIQSDDVFGKKSVTLSEAAVGLLNMCGEQGSLATLLRLSEEGQKTRYGNGDANERKRHQRANKQQSQQIQTAAKTANVQYYF